MTRNRKTDARSINSPQPNVNSSDRASHVFDTDLKKVMTHKTAMSIRVLYNTKATPHEQQLIDDMLGLMTSPLQVAHFFLGAHIELRHDNGKIYDKWMNDFKRPKPDLNGQVVSGPLQQRLSSHVSHGAPQGAFNGHVISHVLFSTRKIKPNDPNSARYTWVQLEKSPIKHVSEWNWRSPKAVMQEIIASVLHLLDFFQYKVTSRNIGAYGSSEYTEKHPLVIDLDKLDCDTAMRQRRTNVWKTIILDKRGLDLDALKGEMTAVGIEFPPPKQTPRINV